MSVPSTPNPSHASQNLHSYTLLLFPFNFICSPFPLEHSHEFSIHGSCCVSNQLVRNHINFSLRLKRTVGILALYSFGVCLCAYMHSSFYYVCKVSPWKRASEWACVCVPAWLWFRGWFVASYMWDSASWWHFPSECWSRTSFLSIGPVCVWPATWS